MITEGDDWSTFSGMIEKREKAARRFRNHIAACAAALSTLAVAWLAMLAFGALGRPRSYNSAVTLITGIALVWWFITALAADSRHKFTKEEKRR